MAKSILHRWAAAGVTPAQVRGWQLAGALMEGNVGPQMKALLKRYGLESLTKWLADAIVNKKSQDQILLELYDQPAFKRRFPAIEAREKANLPPISVDDYLGYEELASSLGSMWGLRLSQSEIDQLLISDVSTVELEERFNIAAQAAFESDQETRNELTRFYNVTQGDLMRYWMNPKEEFAILQNRYRTAEIAGAALRTGYGKIDLEAAERLREAGLDRNAALQGFGELTQMSPLFDPIARGEARFSADEQIALLTGDAGVQRAVQRQATGRLAQFAGGGGFAAGEEGFATAAASNE